MFGKSTRRCEKRADKFSVPSKQISRPEIVSDFFKLE